MIELLHSGQSTSLQKGDKIRIRISNNLKNATINFYRQDRKMSYNKEIFKAELQDLESAKTFNEFLAKAEAFVEIITSFSTLKLHAIDQGIKKSRDGNSQALTLLIDEV